MEFCRNASVSSALPPETSPENVIAPASCDLGSTVNELFPHLRTEEEVSLEWLSVFVEDCLSSTGNCLPTAPHHQNFTAITKPFKSMHKSHQYPSFDTKFAIPVKPRSRRRRPTSPKTHKKPSISWVKSKLLNPMKTSTPQFTSSDPPPLLQQSQWLADSELIMLPRIEGSCCINDEGEESRKGAEEEENKRKKMDVGKESSGGGGVQGGQARRCSHCQAQKTPQWRAGPLGPKTLCNACGVRFKSGRLFPEYRPAKSPTFVSCMHSNSHKKVLEMRMALLASSSPNQH